MVQRRVGLSKNVKTSPLLSNFRHAVEKRIIPPMRKTPKVAVAVDDPPVSSDEEEEDDRQIDPFADKDGASGRDAASSSKGKADALLDSSASSGDESKARGTIKQTRFGRSRETATSPRGVRRKSEEAECVEASGGKRRRLSGASSAHERMATSNTPAGAEENIVSDLGFARVKSARSTYGRKKPSSQEVAKDRRAVMASKATLQVPAMPESPEKAETSRRRLLLPSQPAPMSPKRMGAKLVTERQDDEVIGTILSSPKKAKPVLNQIPLLESPLPSGKLITKTWPRKKRVEAPRSPTPPRAVFKMPAQFADLGDCAGDAKDGPGVVLDDNSSDARNEEKSDSEPVDEVAQKSVASTLPVCPWCNEPVDRVLLAEFSKGKRMNVRQQSRFCHKHRKQTAKTIWQERDYPNVDWDHLERRFSEHRSSLLEIVNGKPSHFRAVLAGKIASGQARSMKKEENLNPGYYGPRGFNLMCDYLVDEFGSLLKEKAVDDRVIAGRGSAAFIQSVLVAELAVHLIRDDMRVSDEEARVILEESRALGEIVHEEE